MGKYYTSQDDRPRIIRTKNRKAFANQGAKRMKNFLGGLGLCAALLGVSYLGSQADADTPPGIEAVMENFQGKKNVHKQVKAALDGKEDWEAITKLTAKYAEAGAALNKLATGKPEKGAQAEWAKLCKEFADLSKELDAAAKKKDKNAMKTILEKLTASCETCHENHR